MDPENRNSDANRTISVSSSFFGSYDHSIDAKGRIIIPPAYRKALGDSFTITVNMDDIGIALYPNDAFEHLIQDLFGTPSRKPAVLRLQDHIAKYSYPGNQADNQGRVLLPVKLRQYALGDAKDVVISGAIDHIRVVSLNDAENEDTYYQAHRNEILDEVSSFTD